MIVLGFDTATPATAVALRLGDGTTLEARDDPSPGERPGHATRLLPLAEELLAQAGVGWEQLERIAVGVGPGTFTGLRIGVATARALAQSLDVDLIGVSTLRALAEGVWVSAPGKWNAAIGAIDARRGEVFAGVYAPGRELLAPCALAPDSLACLLEAEGEDGEGAGGQHVEGSPTGVAGDPLRLAVGDGAVRFRAHLEALGILVPEDSSPLHRVSGACICALAIPREGGLHCSIAPYAAVVPDYLRRPDAEIALEAAAS